jgi:5'-nucleotidase
MKKNIKTILITNDDGFNAAGLKVLKEIAKLFTYDVYVIAPKFNQSAKSRSITLNHEINFEKKSDYEWIVDGTPTDCVIFAINYLMKDFKPDLILSGINAGCNIGDEVSYSGTVAAAWEGALRGINSIALSQFGGNENLYTYDFAKNSAYQIIDNLLNQNFDIPMFFNVNFPSSLSKAVDKNFLYTELANQKKADEIILNQNNKSFKIGQMLTENNNISNTDLEAIKNNKISITPLSLDITNIDRFDYLKDL